MKREFREKHKPETTRAAGDETNIRARQPRLALVENGFDALLDDYQPHSYASSSKFWIVGTPSILRAAQRETRAGVLTGAVLLFIEEGRDHRLFAASSSSFIPSLNACGVICFLYTSSVVFIDL